MMKFKSLISVGTVLLIWLSVTTANPDVICSQYPWDSQDARILSRLAYLSNGSCATVESRHYSSSGYWNSNGQTVTLDPDVEMITIVFDPRTNMSRRSLSLYDSSGQRISSFSNGPYDTIVTIPGNSFRFYFSESRPSSETFGLKFYAIGGNSLTDDRGGFFRECSIRTPFDWVMEHSPSISVESVGSHLQLKAKLELPWCRPEEVDLEFDLSHLSDSERASFSSRSSVSILSEEIFEWESEIEGIERRLLLPWEEEVAEESRTQAEETAEECPNEMGEETSETDESKEARDEEEAQESAMEEAGEETAEECPNETAEETSETDESKEARDEEEARESATEEAGEETTQESAMEEAGEETAQESAMEEAGEETAQESAMEEAGEETAQESAMEEAGEETAQESAMEEAEEETTQESAMEEVGEETAQESAMEEAGEETTQESAMEEAGEEMTQESAMEEAGEETAEECPNETAEETSETDESKEARDEEEAEESAIEEREEASEESAMEIIERAEETEETSEEAAREEKKDEENREETSEDTPLQRRTQLTLIHDFPRQTEDIWRFCSTYSNLRCSFTINAKVAGQVVKFWRVKIIINNESVGSVGAEVDVYEGEEVEENEEVALGFKLIGGFDPRLPPSESYKINDDAFVQIDAPTELEIDYMWIRGIQIKNNGSEMDITSASEVRRMSNILYIARVPLLLGGRVTITITARWYVGVGRRILETNTSSSTSPDTDGESQERIYTLELDVADGQESTDPGTVIITTSEGESESFPSVIMIVAVSTIIIAAIVLFFCYKMKRAKLDAASANAASSDTQRYLATKVKEPQIDTEQEEFVRV